MTRAQAGSRLPAGKARSVPTMISPMYRNTMPFAYARVRGSENLYLLKHKKSSTFTISTLFRNKFSTSISGSISIPISRKNEHFTQRPYRINLHADLVLYSLFLSPVHGPQRFRPIISIKQIAECTENLHKLSIRSLFQKRFYGLDDRQSGSNRSLI